jgi:hypothetical protein
MQCDWATVGEPNYSWRLAALISRLMRAISLSQVWRSSCSMSRMASCDQWKWYAMYAISW